MAHTKDIIILTASTIRGIRATEGTPPTMTERAVLTWMPERLPQACATIRAALGKRVRLIIGETFSYVSSIPLSKTNSTEAAEERLAVKESLQLLIPENLDTTSWDYQTFRIPGNEGAPERYFAEATALTASFARTAIPAIESAGFHIEFTEPESVSLARLTRDESEPLILVSKSESFLIAGIFQGHVLTSISSVSVLTNDILIETKKFIEHKFGISLHAIVGIGTFNPNDFSRINTEKLAEQGLAISFREGSAPEGMLKKDDVTGNDSDILSIELSLPKEPVIEAENQDPKETNKSSSTSGRFRLHFLTERSLRNTAAKEIPHDHSKKRTLILAFVFAIVLIAGGGAIFAIERSRSNQRTQEAPPQDTIESPERDTSQPKETPESSDIQEDQATRDKQASEAVVPEWNRKSFRIIIENGSGIAGAAASLKKTLETAGFVILSIGNTLESPNSTIEASADIPDDFLSDLEDNLPNKAWNIIRNEDTSKNTDIRILIGTDQSEKNPEKQTGTVSDTTVPE